MSVLLLAELLGFSPGRAPVQGAEWIAASSCGGCHPDEHAQWAGSRHAVAWRNALFQEDYAREPLELCVTCHAPLSVQLSAVLDGQEHPSLSEGVTCAVCHVREEGILATSVSGEAPHRSVAVPELASSAFCGSCHEFTIPRQQGGETIWTDEAQQSTWSEWSLWQASGGDQDCQDCHMRDRGHAFPGAHDEELLRGAVQVAVEADAAGTRATISSVGVGHDLPTGDLFRALVFETQAAPGAAWQEVGWMGRRFDLQWDPAAGTYRKVTIADSRLQPGAPVVFSVDSAAHRWRLQYRYTRNPQPAVTILEGTP